MAIQSLELTEDIPLCQQMADPDIWHADKGSEAAKVAKSLCAECPVQPECLKAALDRNEPLGIWGGQNPGERSARKRNETTR